jgi:hypothetical protein
MEPLPASANADNDHVVFVFVNGFVNVPGGVKGYFVLRGDASAEEGEGRF